MRPIEFYTTPEGEVTIREMGMPERQLILMKIGTLSLNS